MNERRLVLFGGMAAVALLYFFIQLVKPEQIRHSIHTLADLQQLPEQQLIYPIAREVRQFEEDEGSNYQGRYDPHIITDFECICSPNQVYLFYNMEFSALGWEQKANLPNNQSGRIWERNGFEISLTFLQAQGSINPTDERQYSPLSYRVILSSQ